MRDERKTNGQGTLTKRITAILGTTMLVFSLLPTSAIAEARNELIEMLGSAGSRDVVLEEVDASALVADLNGDEPTGDDSLEVEDADEPEIVEEGLPEDEGPDDTGIEGAGQGGDADSQRNERGVLTYEDGALKVCATLADPTVLPEGAQLTVTSITSRTKDYNYEAYMAALNEDAGEATKYSNKNTLLYDVAFVAEDENGRDVEVQPTEGSVTVSFEFKKDQLAKKIAPPTAADVTVTHLPLKDSVRGGGRLHG